jgi:hypothetical protein
MEHTLVEFSKYVKELGIFDNEDELYSQIVRSHELNNENYDEKIISQLFLSLVKRREILIKTNIKNDTSLRKEYCEISNGNLNITNKSCIHYNQDSDNLLSNSTSYNAITEVIDAQNLYNGYISLDDKYIINLFKKLILLKSKSLIEIKQKAFLNWKLKSVKIKTKAIFLANEIKLSKLKDELLVVRSRRAKYYDSCEIQFDKAENLFYENDKQNKYAQEREIIQNLKSKSRLGSPEFGESSRINNNNLPYYKIEAKDMPVYEKLYKENFLKENRIKEFIKSRNVEDLKECTFQPKVNTKKFKYHPRITRNEKEPIYDQLNKVS